MLILGISAQMYCETEKKIIDFTLGMIEMKMQNTGVNLLQEVKNILNLYNLNIVQIYSCTSDNGKNMIKLGEVMDQYQQEHIINIEEIEDVTEEISDMSQNESSAELIETMMNEEIEFELSSFLSVIRCSVHTLQLAVHDAMQKLNLGNHLTSVRGVIKKLRTPKYRQIHVDNNANKVQLDVTTRWNSIYIMLQSLMANKDLYKSMYGQKGNKEIEISVADWKFVENYLDAFKPAFIATKNLQSFQLAMSKLILHFIFLYFIF